MFSGELLKPLGGRLLLLHLHKGPEKETADDTTKEEKEDKEEDFWSKIKPLFIVFTL